MDRLTKFFQIVFREKYYDITCKGMDDLKYVPQSILIDYISTVYALSSDKPCFTIKESA